MNGDRWARAAHWLAAAARGIVGAGAAAVVPWQSLDGVAWDVLCDVERVELRGEGRGDRGWGRVDAPSQDDAGRLGEDSPFEEQPPRRVLPMHASPRGKYGNSARDMRYAREPLRTEQSCKDGLDWLKRHQDSIGRWDSDEFMKHDPPHDLCTGPGHPQRDVGVTGLALLAFLADGNTLRRGAYKDVVSRGVRWLRDQQDPESGRFGESIGRATAYDHAIATIAICEAYLVERPPLLRTTSERALGFVSRARNPHGAWSHLDPPNGWNDAAVTAWMALALSAGADSGLAIDCSALDAARWWLGAISGEAVGSGGVSGVGTSSSRVTGVDDDGPAESVEAMKALALLARIFLGDDPADDPAMMRAADRLLGSLRAHEPGTGAFDLHYWYYGTYAMYQLGDPYWRVWNGAMKPAVLDSQRKASDGSHFGSWDPVGPWGEIGGRVHSTALMTLCLEVYYCYARVLDDRE